MSGHTKWSDIKKIKKVPDSMPPVCMSPYHSPPGHRVFKSGIYQHRCPHCGNVTVFQVRNPSL